MTYDDSLRLSRDAAIRQRDECREARAESAATIAKLRLALAGIVMAPHPGYLSTDRADGPCLCAAHEDARRVVAATPAEADEDNYEANVRKVQNPYG